ncbi:MAG: hypothetical protein JO180_04670 [Gemmatirosa sp.]|nr:hypothetical protein [Gemmatirosa sp.]
MPRAAKSAASAATPPAAVQETAVAAKVGLTVTQLRSTKLVSISDTARAKYLGVRASGLVRVATPIVLSPAKPITGSSSLTLFTAMMVDPTWPTGSGQALFSSGFPGGVDPGAQVAFPRLATGKTHLVEFYVTLNKAAAYKFRVFTYPLGDFVDVVIQGPKSTVIPALAPPVDQIAGALELGASIQQRNTKADDAGWSLQSVQVNTTG